jgi:hypothetical protein
MTRVLRAIAAGVLLWAAPATAQAPGPKPIDVAADSPWLHANSGMTFPLTLAGFSRTMVREYEAPQLDVIGTWTRGDEEELSVYVYRSTAGSVPVWFDRATWAIESRGLYGRTTPAQVPAAFRAPGAAVDSGLIASWTTEGRYKGTGVAILPLGDWLVKLRFSSTSRDGAGAAAVLREAAPIAAPIPTCATPIGFKGEAKSAKLDGSAAILSAAFAQTLSGPVKDENRAAAWCRDALTLPTAGIYRPDGSTDSYLLALSDAGRGIWVAPSLAGLLGGKKSPSWAVDLVLPGRTLNFPPQDRLPRPERALALLQGGAVSSVSTWGDKREITLPSLPK